MIVRPQICPAMFPAPRTGTLPLDRCMRFLPHHNDDGGFFVAIIKKTRENNAEKAREKNTAKTRQNSNVGGAKKSRQSLPKNIMNQRLAEKVVAEGSALERFKEYIGLQLDNENIVHWTKDDKVQSSLYLVNNGLRDIVRANSDVTAAHLGCRILQREARKNAAFQYRVVAENLHLLEGRISSRLVELSRRDFYAVISSQEIDISQLSQVN